ncbi:MAG: HAD hydrolase family protein [Betaproteobacteria bacterium]|uniref:3-deoxy-D-manno-octulosonate 8-phosphate phosphatase KdsC n=1 Tax=Candidatus Proximibacter danicus TaxID=2954365 RepID=A0A9D7PRM9_9PROT|nr:HAD hydrolase family protein [Candidatus Proximibacter danicus]
MDAGTLARKVRLMAFDVDGVMTDGAIYYTDEGTELKAFNALDGAGLKMLEKAGITVAIITGRKAPCVELRARNLGISRLFQGVHDKAACVNTLLAELGLSADEAGYMGDDVMDLAVMGLCGFSAAPANAHDSVLQRAALVTRKHGGHGAVREVCDFILSAQGKLEEVIAPWLPQ